MTKRFGLMLALTLLAGLTAFAQEKTKTEAKPADPKTDATKPAMALPTVDEILDKYVKAIGGKEAVMKQTSRVMKGTFEIEAMSMSGAMEIAAKAPNKSATIIELPGVGSISQIFDGEKAWSNNPMEGLREMTGGELAAIKRRSDFYGELNLKKQFSKLEVKGKEKVGASDAYVLVGTDPEGGPVKMYFDVSTGYLVRTDAELETAQGKISTESYAEDYKEVDGVKVAHTMRQVTPMMSFTMKITEVKNNVEIDEKKFTKPSGQ